MILWALVGVGGIAGVLALSAGEPLIAGLPACAMRSWFHMGCASCGFTRAAVQLAHGDIAGSWMLHPFAAVAAAEGALAWVAWGIGLWRGRPLFPAGWWGRVLVLTATGAVGFWLVRMILGTIPG